MPPADAMHSFILLDQRLLLLCLYVTREYFRSLLLRHELCTSDLHMHDIKIFNH